ncbi:Glycine rich protein [Prevotellaceae bacterium MN60]|nr:Glycine rich protein [Prevotellaceae bacterium MN60]
MRYDHSIYAVAAALLLTACTQDIAQEFFAGNDDNSVTFTAQTIMTEDETRSVSAPEALPLTGDGLNLWLMPSETPMGGDVTRGTQINSVSELSSFGVSAFKHGAIPSGKTLNEYLTDNHLKPDFFYNMEATKVTGTEKFKLTTNYYWPASNETLSFFAYAPYGDGNVGLSAETAEGPQVITFKVNTVVKDQADFMTAQASSTAHTSASETPSVRLNFTHHLTGVRFVLGDQFLKGWVKSISLKGVYTEGKYTIGGNWTLDDTKKGNFTISYNMDKPVTGTPSETVTAPNETFLMIPHTFADDDAATIEVVYNDGYTDYIVSAPLKGQTWRAGKTVTYAITSKKLTTLQISSITFPDTPEGDYKRAWAAGDKVGMYVVGSDGLKLKHKNIPVTFDGTKWNIDHTTAEGTIYKLPGESFYFYYPYSTVSNNQPLGYPEQCPELKAEAPTFFEGVIYYFPIKADQSNPTDHVACDLQVAKAEDEGHASTIKATMLRQVGLARFKFAQKKTIPETVTYTYSGANATTNTKTTTGSVTIYPSTNFVGNKPYLGDNGIYFFFTKAGMTTTFNSNPSDVNHWLEAVNITLAAGEYTSDTKMITVQDYRYQWISTVSATWKLPYNTQETPYTIVNSEPGTYTMECWGASGATLPGAVNSSIYYPVSSDKLRGGKGAYVKGTVTLGANISLYVYVGRQGSYSDGYCVKTFNGGGGASRDIADDYTVYAYGNVHASGSGGGATDVRLVKHTKGKWGIYEPPMNLGEGFDYNEWDNSRQIDYVSFNSRLLVAAGGGAANNYVTYNGSWNYMEDRKSSEISDSHGGDAGGLIGYSGNRAGTYLRWYEVAISQPGTQSAPESTYHGLGYGGNGGFGGGGGGYYGGAGGGSNNSIVCSGAGGSSFIAGHPGCLSSVNGYTLSSTKMIDGLGKQWTTSSQTTGGTYVGIPRTSGSGTETGHEGNGYCIIKYTR